MKKPLSFLLLLCTVFLCASGCASRASAQMVGYIPNASEVPALKEKQELLYSENFENTDYRSQTNANLIEALGWSGYLGTSDSLSIVDQNGGHALSVTAHTTRMDTVCVFDDPLLAGGDYILEYTVRLVDNFKEDPERNFGFCSESATTFSTNTNTAWRFAIKENGTSDHHLKIDANKVSDGGNSVVVKANDGTSPSLVGSSYRVRIIVDSEFGVSAYLLDGQNATLISATNPESSALWKQNSRTLGSELRLHILSGITATFDDIQIWTCKKVNKGLPTYLGFQVSPPRMENTEQDIRFIAGVRTLNAKSMGMKVTYHFKTDRGDPCSETKTVYADTVYESISSDFGYSTYAKTKDYPYLMALSLSDVPARMSVTYEITTFAVIEENGTEKTEYGTTYTMTLDRGVSATVPTFQSRGFTPTAKFSESYFRQYYPGTGIQGYEDYCASLLGKGYTLYSKTTLDGNHYATYSGDHLMLHVYFIAQTGATTVLSTFKENWIPHQTESYGDAAVTTPKLSMMNMDYGYAEATNEYVHNNGMGFAYTLEDGSYVIIDGGYGADAEPLYEYLRTNNKRADGKILIRAWILTHPDGDHIGCFIRFSIEHAKDVTLESLVMQPDADTESLWGTVKSCISDYKGCRYIVPLAGQTMYFGTLKIDFFYTAEMYHLYGTPPTNESSLAFKGTLGGVTVFFGGDIVGNAIRVVDSYYSKSLKSDFLQAPHHGLNGSKGLYSDVLPDYLLLCTHKQAAKERWENGRYGYQSYLYYLHQLGCVKEAYVADEKVNVFELREYASAK